MAAVIMACPACTPDKPPSAPTSTPVPMRRPVPDRSPYLCYFIPEAAVAELTGYTGPYKAGSAKRDPDGYGCVISNDEQSLFITSYDVSASQKLIENFTEFGKNRNPVKLPEELGTGEISDFETRLYPYRKAGVWFRCGSDNSLITIVVKRNPVRDQDHDLIQLMQIAQRRFAEMFKCKLGGPPPG
ncbi:hypothetical protein ABZ912_34040 [Nonomuraea angiospora]|uniref:hypothetical protein n=1 Tax=Nonomuraea angiospora TaxID=46172 RepID=UPI0033FA8713